MFANIGLSDEKAMIDSLLDKIEGMEGNQLANLSSPTVRFQLDRVFLEIARIILPPVRSSNSALSEDVLETDTIPGLFKGSTGPKDPHLTSRLKKFRCEVIDSTWKINPVAFDPL